MVNYRPSTARGPFRVQAILGAALLLCVAAGVGVFSRSFKYHRPRGLLCCAGHCPNCLVQVGACLLYTSPSPRDRTRSRMPSSA